MGNTGPCCTCKQVEYQNEMKLNNMNPAQSKSK